MLSNVDRAARTATCSICGPVPVTNGSPGRFRCALGARRAAGQRRLGIGYEPPFRGVCPICERERRLVYDHDHHTGRKRGNICSSCNAALGLVDDEPAILRAAADYLERSRSREDALVHVTATGHRIEYRPLPKVEAFLARLERAVNDPTISARALVGLAYSRANPILDHACPARGPLTPRVLEDPAYAVMTDLLFRKQAAEDGTLDEIATSFSMTVKEAAATARVTEGSIRDAIAARRLASWRKGKRHFLHPAAVQALVGSS